MSATSPTSPPVVDLEDLLERNPDVDASQVREAQEALKELRREGVIGPSYNIDSPYERGPVAKPES
jgi:hypothetical protein